MVNQKKVDLILNKRDIKLTKKRCSIYRIRILEISQKVSALHLGGSFSCTEILDILFNKIMTKIEKKLFILSKGHASILQYVILESQKTLSKFQVNNYCKKKGFLGVHPDRGNPGINASTGSLGHGLAMATGIALAERKTNNRIFVVLSDGELQEGSTWEAIISIGALKLNNLVAIIDNNNLQSLEKMNESHPNIYPIEEKIKSFGWNALSCNGHNSSQLFKIINQKKENKPLAIIAKTTKGYPLSMFKDPIWHYRSPNNEQYLKAIKELKNEK